MTVKIFAHSSLVVAIFRLTFTITLQGHLPRRRALATYMTKCPLAFVPHCQYSIIYNGLPLQYPDGDLRGSCSSHPHLHRSSVKYRLGVVSPSTQSSVSPPVYPPLPPGASRESSALFAGDNSLHVQLDAGVVPRARTPISPRLVLVHLS